MHQLRHIENKNNKSAPPCAIPQNQLIMNNLQKLEILKVHERIQGNGGHVSLLADWQRKILLQ